MCRPAPADEDLTALVEQIVDPDERLFMLTRTFRESGATMVNQVDVTSPGFWEDEHLSAFFLPLRERWSTWTETEYVAYVESYSEYEMNAFELSLADIDLHPALALARRCNAGFIGLDRPTLFSVTLDGIRVQLPKRAFEA